MRVKGLPVFTAEDKLEAPSLCASDRASDQFLPQRVNWKPLHFVRVKGLPIFNALDKLEAPSLCANDGASGFYRRG